MGISLTKKLAVTSCVAILSAMATCASSNVIYSEDFTSGSTSGWVTYDSSAWSIVNNAYQVDAWSGGAAFTALRSDVTLPSNWVFSEDAKWVSSHWDNDLNYGVTGLALSSSQNGFDGDWVMITANHTTRDETSAWVTLKMDYRIGGVSGYVSDWAIYDFSGNGGPYHVVAERAQGSNTILATLSGVDLPWSATCSKAFDATALDNMKYFGVCSYFSVDQHDNILLTSTVPEPASVLGLISGFAGLLGFVRRKR